MQLHERRHRSRFQRSFSDRHHYGQNRTEEREEQYEEQERQYRIVKRTSHRPKTLDPMKNIIKWIPIALAGAVGYWLLTTYVI